MMWLMLTVWWNDVVYVDSCGGPPGPWGRVPTTPVRRQPHLTATTTWLFSCKFTSCPFNFGEIFFCLCFVSLEWRLNYIFVHLLMKSIDNRSWRHTNVARLIYFKFFILKHYIIHVTRFFISGSFCHNG